MHWKQVSFPIRELFHYSILLTRLERHPFYWVPSNNIGLNSKNIGLAKSCWHRIMCSVLTIRSIQEEVATPTVSNPFFSKCSDRSEGKKEHMLNQPQTAQSTCSEWVYNIDRAVRLIFFPLGKGSQDVEMVTWVVVPG